MIKRFGGEVCDGERITHIEPGVVVVVRTAKAEYRSRSIVITAGAWASQLLTPPGIKTTTKGKAIDIFLPPATVVAGR